DLNTTRYGVDQAVQELVEVGNLVRIIPNNGKANHFYINDIYENEMEEESMMTLDSIMANMPMEEREIIMDKMVKASRDILETIADMGYLDEYGTPLTSMEERNYRDELGFEIGGNSIQAIQITNQMTEKIGCFMDIGKLFEYPTISKIERYILEET
ncbi:acyl carrier protein, partial [Anaerostipes hadrus]